MTPTRVHAHLSRRTSILYWPDKPAGVEFYMRGAVCWPMLVEREDGAQDVQGYAILAGVDLATGVIEVMEETSFVTVEHVLNPDGTIQYRGLASWFNANWAHYYGDTYFWNQGGELNRKYLLEVVRSPWCKPQPHFVEIDWQDEAEARQLVWRYVKTRRLLLPKEGQLFRDLGAAKMDKKDVTMPTLHALQCLLAGLERYPWRDHTKKQPVVMQWERQNA